VALWGSDGGGGGIKQGVKMGEIKPLPEMASKAKGEKNNSRGKRALLQTSELLSAGRAPSQDRIRERGWFPFRGG